MMRRSASSSSFFDQEDQKKTIRKEMSETSKRYDRHGKGYLDDAERKLRELDTQNKGEVDLETAHQIMTKLLVTQDKFLNLKRLTIVMFSFVLILSLCNLGTAFAAFYLARETKVSGDSELVDVRSGDMVKVQSMGPFVEVTDKVTVFDDDMGMNRTYFVVAQDSMTKALEDVMRGAESMTLHGKERHGEEGGEHEYSSHLNLGSSCDLERNKDGEILSFSCRSDDQNDGGSNGTTNRNLEGKPDKKLPLPTFARCQCSVNCDNCASAEDYYCCVEKQ